MEIQVAARRESAQHLRGGKDGELFGTIPTGVAIEQASGGALRSSDLAGLKCQEGEADVHGAIIAKATQLRPLATLDS